MGEYRLNALKTFFLLLLVSGCASSGAVSQEFTAEAIDTISANTEIVNNNSLEWWQWIIVGMFIPSPLDYLSEVFGGVGGFILKLFGRN
ncbi:membrane lipoprotein [Vibrio phage 1.253.O._10N.286.45.B12]|nr:membrane lipoprotein [Vibrio phage 1.235.O._10N.261.52.B2]AUR98546.1 membrane lipoprotein [Vibrio phage 1.253.O._10N.286.45.B12]